jgi:L-alanine-DL-glutamate epimerase-like enolase superfamily enzyme
MARFEIEFDPALLSSTRMKITAIRTHPASIPFEVHRVTAHEPMRRAAIREGCVHLEDAPGFGIDIDWNFIERHRA